jgi:hypothetical protein
MDSVQENLKTKGSKSHNNMRSRNHRTKATKKPAQPVQDQGEEEGACSSEDEGELCFICAEPVVTYAVAQCDHRTCHRCTLRLRALYETRNCAYCKVK